MSAYLPVNPEKNRELDQAAWTTARRLRQFSYASLGAELHIDNHKAAALIKRWLDVGAVNETEGGKSGRRQFVIIKDVEDTPVKHRKTVAVSSEQAMWIAIRRSGTFTAIDIEALANTEEHPLTIEGVRSYLATLLAAGYLRVARLGIRRKQAAAYRLIKDTGPLAPTTKRVTVTIDANLKQVVHVPTVAS